MLGYSETKNPCFRILRGKLAVGGLRDHYVDAPLIVFGQFAGDAFFQDWKRRSDVEEDAKRRVRPPARVGPRRQPPGWGAVRIIWSLQGEMPLPVKVSG